MADGDILMVHSAFSAPRSTRAVDHGHLLFRLSCAPAAEHHCGEAGDEKHHAAAYECF